MRVLKVPLFFSCQILGWGRSMGSFRGTIPCSSKRKIGGQLWCLIWLKEKVQFFAPKKLETLSLREFRQISVGKKNRQIVVSNVSSCSRQNWREKRWKKRSILRSLSIEEKTICARYIRGFLFIRKNSCSRLRFGNSFRYSKQKEEKKKKFRQNRKKYVKNTNFLLRPYMKRRVFDKKCFTLRVFINLW